MAEPMQRLMAYLGGPYSDPDQAVVEARMEQFCRADAHLMEQGYHTMSPMLKHFILQYRKLPGNYAYWGDYSRNMLKRANVMIVLHIDGWDTSEGLADEMAQAEALGIPIRHADAEGNLLD